MHFFFPFFTLAAMVALTAAAPAQVAPQAATPSLTVDTSLDQRLSQAQSRFAAGKRMLHDGDTAGARTAFDQAIEILLQTPVAAADRERVERRVEELIDLIYRYDVEGLGSGEEKDKVVFDKSPLDEIRESTPPLDPKLTGLVKHQIEATVSQLPLEMNDTVLGFINYFTNGRGRNTLISGWRRSHRYRPMIQRILAEEGVPQELIYLAQAESGFLPRAVSHKAACGMWQFVAWRGNEYGLEQTKLYDLRLDPEKATRAAAKHLRDLYMQFGDWHLAVAAYNCGPGCVARAVERTGYADYWNLRRLNAIPKETTNYVPIIMALTIVTKNAAEYGIKLDDPDPVIEYDVMRVDSPTNLDLIADAADLPVSGIRDLNPALLKNVAPAGFELRVPKGQSQPIAFAMDSVPAAQRAAWRLHRVRPGDNLSVIAQRYKTTAKSILTANTSGAAERLDTGDVLMIPVSYTQPAPGKAVKGKTAAPAASKRGASAKATGGTARKSSSRAAAKRPVFRTSGRRASSR